MTNEELLLDILEKARDASDTAFHNAPLNLDPLEFRAYMQPYNNAASIASRNYRMVQTPKIEDEKDTIGDIMTLEDFIDCCKSGGFIDYDGSGAYSVGGKASNIMIYPSDIKHNCVRTDFNEIIWYNR